MMYQKMETQDNQYTKGGKFPNHNVTKIEISKIKRKPPDIQEIIYF